MKTPISDKLFGELLDDINIFKSIELAKNARLYLDPFIEPELLNEINSDDLNNTYLVKTKARLNQNEIKLKPYYDFIIPKNKADNRTGIYLNFEDYIIKFLIALIIKKHTTFPDVVFAGNDEIFELVQHDIFKEKNKEFVKWQSDQLYKSEFQYIVSVDIENYYNSIKSDILISKIAKELSLELNSRFHQLLAVFFSDLTMGSWPDHFIHNFYFKDLDQELNKFQKFKYGRLTDDLRVITKDEQDAFFVFYLIIRYLKKNHLKLNNNKAFIITPADISGFEYAYILNKNKIRKYEFENLIRYLSSVETLYSIIDEKKLPRQFYTYEDYLKGREGFIIDEKEVFDYYITCKNTDGNSITHNEIKNLFKILKHFNGSYRFYQDVVDLIYTFAITSPSKVKSLIFRQTIDFLNTENYSYLYIKYLILRRLFFDNENRNYCYTKLFNTNNRKVIIEKALAKTLIRTDELFITKTISYVFEDFLTDNIIFSNKKMSFWNKLVKEIMDENLNLCYINSYRSHLYRRLHEIFPESRMFFKRYVFALIKSENKTLNEIEILKKLKADLD